MRWKLLVTASIVAALIGFGLWCAFALGLFGSVRVLARHDRLLVFSLVFPLGLTIIAAIFTYRHTARRRKLQALITAFLVLIFTVLVYVTAWMVIPSRLYVPRTYEVQHAR